MNGPAVSPAVLEAAEFDPFAGETIERVIATSEAQREIWLADQLDVPASLAFNESVRLRLLGPLDVAALQGAFAALVRRHDALRCTVSPDGAELLVGSGTAAALSCVDLGTLHASARADALDAAAAAAVETPFALDRGPLFRATLFRLAEAEHVLLMTAHHIVCDGWSWGVIADDLGLLYAEQTGHAPGPDPAPSYADYVAWESAQAASQERREDERFWLGRFPGDSVPVLELPTDRLRPPVRTFASRRVDRRLDATLVEAVRKTAAGAGASLFATLFSAFAATLARIAGQDDLVIGVPAAGQSASGLDRLVGHCVNLLPVRTSVDAAETFADYLQRSAAALLDAFEHQNLTFGSLLKKLPLRRDPSRLPLVSVMFNVDQTTDVGGGTFPGGSVELTGNARVFENLELFVNASRANGGLVLECQYNTDLFDADTIARWLGAYEALLRAAVAEPLCRVGRLQWLEPKQTASLRALQPAATPRSDDLMQAPFVRQAARTPDRCALSGDGARLTYAELDQRSNRLARALHGRGVQRGDRVGLCLGRQPDMLVALLAVLKAGAAYVPLDPGYPAARLAWCAEDAALALLLTESSAAVAPRAWRADAAARVISIDTDVEWHNESPSAFPASESEARPEDAAYVIYTSGSTGKPKGVAVPHRAVANFLASMAKEPGIRAEDRLAAVTTLSFDIAVLELLLPLGAGAKVQLVSRETAMDGRLLAALLDSSGATMMQATPGTWRTLVDAGWRGGSGFRALVGGESLPPELAYDLLERTAELWNLYGPTETTVWSTAWRVGRAALAERGMSIGRPIDNTSVWILDEELQPCPIGVPGEICIGGAGVALGYLNRPELTAERFVADPWGAGREARLYRTGDRGRWRSDGLLDHLGRLDFQVKVRGYRIELGEIEAACETQPGVARSVVLAREDRSGDVRLVAYLTPTQGMTIDEKAVRAALRARLPDYMLPQHLVVLPALPELPNGKIDRRALPAPLAAASSASHRVAPRTDSERTVATAMEAVLRLPGLSVDDDFFALGGHSLLAAQLATALGRASGVRVPMRTVFDAPTIARLAAWLDGQAPTTATERAAIASFGSVDRAPASLMQQRVWFLEQLDPGLPTYLTPSAHRLLGPLDVPALERSLAEMVRRQAVLRTEIVAEDGVPVQRILPSLAVSVGSIIDLSALPASERDPQLMASLNRRAAEPIDIGVAPLFRLGLYKLADEEHVLFFMPHHIIWDGWSFDLFYEEMAALYGAFSAGREPNLAPLTRTYADFAQWQRDWLRSDDLRQQLAHWKRRLADLTPPLSLPLDRPRPRRLSGAGEARMVGFSQELTERARSFGQGHDATLFMTLLAVFALLLSRLSGQREVVIGSPVRGRDVAEVEKVMGFFVNALPLRLRVEPEQSFVEVLAHVREVTLDAFSAPDVPFEHLVQEMNVPRDESRSPIYQAFFSFQDARQRLRRWGGLQQEQVHVFQPGAAEEVGLWFLEHPQGLAGGLSYSTDLFSAETAGRFADCFGHLLSSALDDAQRAVGDLTMLPASELALLKSSEAPEPPPVATSAAAVPAPSEPAGAPASAAAAGLPLTESEREVALIWKELLGVADVQPGDNFFDLGGHSLLAMRVIANMKKRLGVQVPVRRLIYESLAQIAATPPAAVPARADDDRVRVGLVSRVFGRFGKRP